MIALQILTVAALAVLVAFCALGLDDTHHDTTTRGNR